MDGVRYAESEGLAKCMKETFKGGHADLGFADPLECFLDRDDRSDLQNLVDNVAFSRCFVFVLSKHALDSPWCMLELLAAVMNGVEVVFVQLEGHSMGTIGFPDKLTAMAFPEADRLMAIKVIKHSKDYYDAFMGLVAARVAGAREQRPSPAPSVGSEQVYGEFRALQERRNKAFPAARPWEIM